MSEDLQPIGPYLVRMRRTIAYIEANLDEELDLDTLSPRRIVRAPCPPQ
jgi:hypothetical protein